MCIHHKFLKTKALQNPKWVAGGERRLDQFKKHDYISVLQR
jgi:hypothetical protein